MSVIWITGIGEVAMDIMRPSALVRLGIFYFVPY